MPSVPLTDILINARQESHRMRHHFLGVEHLFIGLLEIKRGLASSILTDMGLSPEYVVDAIRRKTGKGSKSRMWTGMPKTPRAEVILSLAQEIASEHGRTNIEERDLLLAIIDEQENIPIRVLISFIVDIEHFRKEAVERKAVRFHTNPFVAVDMSPELQASLGVGELFILRRMFHGHARVRVETELTGGYTPSTILVVTPITLDGREEASVVVKIGSADAILDEMQRYERYVKSTLPPFTARVVDRPVAPDTSDLAAVKYTLLTDGNGETRDMRATVREWTGGKLGRWLHNHLYQEFGKKWWQQNRAYKFEVWREYDWVLPPMLTLELYKGDSEPPDAKELRTPIRQSQFRDLRHGDTIILKNFIVQKVDRDNKMVQLALTQGANTTRAYQIEVRGVNLDDDTYFRGEAIDKLIGKVWRTRDDQLWYDVREIEPPFDVTMEHIRVGKVKYPNPIKAYRDFMDMAIQGTVSTIHGDLHLGNILVGPGEAALLIDFGRTRDGHTIFDWATLEISIISEMLVPMVEDSWSGANQLMGYLMTVNHPDLNNYGLPEDITEALQALTSLRELVATTLARHHQWHEYYVGLALLALRALTWHTMSRASRRVMYLLSALSMKEALAALENGRDSNINATSPESTELGEE